MPGYEARIEILGADAMRLGVRTHGDRRLARGETLSLWKSDAAFGTFFSDMLAASPFEGLFWETPPLTPQSLDAPFESVVLRGAALARQKADPAPFAKHIGALHGESKIAAFSNLGGDADLIVPCDSGTGADYAHLAAFLRTAPAAQKAALWSTVAEAVEPWLARGERFWVSTAGLGVSWVHVRIDSRPKYYRHAPYKII
jgi:hypothetical protein